MRDLRPRRSWWWPAVLACGLAAAATGAAAETLVVAGTADPCLRVHVEPSLGGDVVACPRPGERVELIDRGEIWAEIILADGTRGYCVVDYLEPPPEARPPAPAPPRPAAAAPPAGVTPVEELTRITFAIPFAEERGGGSASGSAETVETVGETLVVASGGVEFAFRGTRLQAQRLEVDRSTRDVVAEGEVILDEGPQRLTGTRLEYNLDSRTGRLIDARVFADPDIYFTGAEVAILGDDRFHLKDGVVTSCFNDNPAWSFRTASARVKLEGFARIRHTRMRVKGAPVFYLPYMLLPAKSDRAAGLLFPNFGTSQRRGSYLGLAYFQPFGRSYDATLFLDLYSEDFLGVGTEFRYTPSQSTGGWFEGYAIDDPLEEENRWKIAWDHTSDALPLGFRGVVRVRDYSDFEFFRDFERDFNNASIRRVESTGFLTGNWGAHSLNILVSENQAFIGQGVTVTGQQLPEIEYRLRSQQLGRLPLYLDLLSSVNAVSIERTGLLDESYSRYDFFPQLTIPLSTLPWLSVSVTGGERITYYEKSLTEGTNELTGGSLTRTFSTATAQIVGPSLSRVFEKPLGPFAKFKHIFEPRWGWAFIGDFEDQDRVPRFDEVDVLRSSNLFGYALVNRVLAKPADEKLLGGPREILSFEINQAFSLDDEQPLQASRDGTMSTTEGPLGARLRFNPSRRMSLEARAQYSTLFGNLDSTSLSTNFGVGRQSFGLSWFTRYDAETGDDVSDQARISASLQILPGRLTFGSQIAYDLRTELVQQDRHVLVFNSQCWGFRLDYARFRSQIREDYDIRFALTLKNVGTFLDLTGGTRGGQF